MPTRQFYQRQRGMSKYEKIALDKLMKKHNLKDEDDAKRPEKDLAVGRQPTYIKRDALMTTAQ